MKFQLIFLLLHIVHVAVITEAKVGHPTSRRTQSSKKSASTPTPTPTSTKIPTSKKSTSKKSTAKKSPSTKPPSSSDIVTVEKADEKYLSKTPSNKHPKVKKNNKTGGGGSKKKGSGGGSKGSGGSEGICLFDPTNPTSSLGGGGFSFRADYCYSESTCEADRCTSCGVAEEQREDYYCVPPQIAGSIFGNPDFSPNKNIAKCTECCQGKVSSVVFEVTEPGINKYSLPEANADAYFVDCSALSDLLNKGEARTTTISKSKDLEKGEKLCVAPVTNIVNGTADINIDVCESGPSNGLKAVFDSNDVLIFSDAFPEGSATFHVSCSQSVNPGTCMVGGSGGTKGEQIPPPEGTSSCEPYPALLDGSSTQYWSSATAKFCSPGTRDCFRGNFKNCGCCCTSGPPSPPSPPSPTPAPSTKSKGKGKVGGSPTPSPTPSKSKGKNSKAPTPGGKNSKAPTPGGKNSKAPTPGGKSSKAPTPGGKSSKAPTPGGKSSKAPTPVLTVAPTSCDYAPCEEAALTKCVLSSNTNLECVVPPGRAVRSAGTERRKTTAADGVREELSRMSGKERADLLREHKSALKQNL